MAPRREAVSGRPDTSTAPRQPSRAWTRFEAGLRGVTYVVVFGVVIAALAGLAGLRTREAAASNDQLRVVVTYAQVARPGISAPFEIAIDSVGGGELPDELDVEVSSAYLAMFDENGLGPEPDTAASDGTTETWTYRPQGEAALHIDLDARVQPNVHSGETATVRVAGPGVDPIQLEVRTWVLP